MEMNAFLKGMKDPDLKYTEDERDEILDHMLGDRTWRAHATKTMEECAELQCALSKHITGDGDKNNLLEEMADVYISLWLTAIIFDISDADIEKAIDVKLKRNEFRHQVRKKDKHDLER